MKGKTIEQLLQPNVAQEEGKAIELYECLQSTGNWSKFESWSKFEGFNYYNDVILLAKNYFTPRNSKNSDLIAVVGKDGGVSVWRGEWNDGVLVPYHTS